MKKKKIYINICEFCHEPFETTLKTKKTCCKEHRYKMAKSKEEKTKGIVFADLSERKCLNCGRVFKPVANYVKTCCRKCGYEYRSKEQLENTEKIYCKFCNEYYLKRDKAYITTRSCGKPDCVKKATQETNLENYGVTNISKSKDYAEKRKQKCFEKHGVHYPQQRHIAPLTLELFEDKQFLEDLHIVREIPIEIIAKQYGVSSFFVANKLKKFGIKTIHYGSSFEEKELFKYIKLLCDKVKRNTRSVLPSKKELDIYIPNLKVGIEFNGVFWHSEQRLKKLGHEKFYHLNKTKEAEALGIHLIHIFQDDWQNKKDIIKNRLLHILQKNTFKINARQCIVKEIPYKEAKLFIDKYHLQSNNMAIHNLGLFYNNELVACMSFSKLRKALGQKNKERFYELLRYCSSTRVAGGASKLFSYFLHRYNPIQIVSYADRCWTTSCKETLYDKLGFTKVSEGSPNYWYIIKSKKVHRFNYRKSELSKKLAIFDPNLSEYENMLNNKYDRIWDCGSFKYIYNNIVV